MNTSVGTCQTVLLLLLLLLEDLRLHRQLRVLPLELVHLALRRVTLAPHAHPLTICASFFFRMCVM